MRFHGPRGYGARIDVVGFVPFAVGHLIENIGGETVRDLEPSRSPAYADLSLIQWMALTPPEFVQALQRTRHPVVPA